MFKRIIIFVVLIGLVSFGVFVIVGRGGSELSEAEYEARYGFSRDGTSSTASVEIGDCVNAAPNSRRSVSGAEITSCDSSSALAEVVSIDTSTCGPGYVSGTGRNIAVARVEYEEVCIEELANATEREIEMLDKGEPGSKSERCLAEAEHESETLRCYNKYGISE